MRFAVKYTAVPDPALLDLSDSAVEHDALDAAGRLRTVVHFLRALATVDYEHPRDWGADADELEAIADVLAHNTAPDALARQSAGNVLS